MNRPCVYMTLMLRDMGTILSLALPGLVCLAGILWAYLIVGAWRPAAERRGGYWALEAILLICGPITTVAIAMYPPGGTPSVFQEINHGANLTAVALAAWVILKAVSHPRKNAGWVTFAVLTFYAVLGVSTVGGVVPDFPEAYWTTPLVVLAFLVYGRYSSEWLLKMSRLVIRLIVVLSFAAILLLPQIVFNLEEARTVFGIHRLQGLMGHPNGFAALAVVGFMLELHARSRLIWRGMFLVAVILAQSTTGIIALVIGLLVMTNALSKAFRVALYLGAVATLLIALFGGNEWLMSTFVPEQAGTLTGRTAIWAAALVGFQLNPWFGYGPTLLGQEYRNSYLPNFDAAAQAHNQFVQTLGGEGITGLASLVILISVLLFAAFRVRKSTDGLSVALVMYLVVRGVTETPLRPAGPGSTTFILIVVFGLLVATLSEIAAESPAIDDHAKSRSEPKLEGRTIRAEGTGGEAPHQSTARSV